MNSPRQGVRIGDPRWWMAVGVTTVGILIIVIGIGFATFIGTINPAAVEVLAIAMLVTLGLVSVYVAARSLSRRS